MTPAALASQLEGLCKADQSERTSVDPLRSAGRILCFFSVVLAMAFLLDSVICFGLRRITTSGFGVSNRIVEGRINADIVISGSSRALTHYDSRIIQGRTGRTAFNLGLNGSQTDMQLARLKTYLRHNTKPSLLIHNLDLFTFQTTHEGVYDPGQYVPYLHEPAIYTALTRINADTWKSRFIPLYGYAVEDLRFTWLLGMMGVVGWNPVEDYFLGFKPRHTFWTGDFERFKAMNPDGVRFEVEPDGVSEMEELLRLCEEQAIGVLLIYSPEYAEMQALTSNRADIFGHFEDLAKRFGVAIWDYSASSISLGKENFYNSQHLNATGAAAFSNDVAARLASTLNSSVYCRFPTNSFLPISPSVHQKFTHNLMYVKPGRGHKETDGKRLHCLDLSEGQPLPPELGKGVTG